MVLDLVLEVEEELDLGLEGEVNAEVDFEVGLVVEEEVDLGADD